MYSTRERKREGDGMLTSGPRAAVRGRERRVVGPSCVERKGNGLGKEVWLVE